MSIYDLDTETRFKAKVELLLGKTSVEMKKRKQSNERGMTVCVHMCVATYIAPTSADYALLHMTVTMHLQNHYATFALPNPHIKRAP